MVGKPGLEPDSTPYKSVALPICYIPTYYI